MAQPLSAEHLALLAALQEGALAHLGLAPAAAQQPDAMPAAPTAAAASPQQQQQQQQQQTPGGTPGYRQRAPTNFRGVTRTSGTTSGVPKFDVQFVFCDNGTKKHPKIYGFSTMDAAARAFDLLTCKRAMEKGRGAAAVQGDAINSLGTNHPGKEYQDAELLSFLEASSRDDLIYGLKQCAKKGLALAPGPDLVADLRAGVEAARGEAAEKQRMGDPRQSYEVASKVPADRKRKAAPSSGLAGSKGATAALPTQPASFAANADSMLAAAAAAMALGQQAAQQAQQAQAALQVQAAQQAAAAALMLQAQQAAVTVASDAVSLKAEDIVGSLVRSNTLAATSTDTPRAAKAATAGGAGVSAAAGAPVQSPAGGAAGSKPEPEGMDVEGAAQEGSREIDTATLKDQAASAEGGGAVIADAGGPATAAAAAAGSAAGAAQATRVPSLPLALQMLAQQAQQPQQAAPEQLLLAQLLQSQLGGGAQQAQQAQLAQHALGASGRLASQGLPLLLEVLRLSGAASPEMGAVHDIVRIWAAVQQGQAWPADQQTHLPQHYYQGLLPILQACPDVASILALTSQLWQTGMLRMLCSTYATTLQQQAAASGPLGALLGALTGGQSGPGLGQLAALLSVGAGAAPAAGGNALGLAALLQGPGSAQSQLGVSNAGQLGPLASQLAPLLAAAARPQAAPGQASMLATLASSVAVPPAQQPLGAVAGAAAAVSGRSPGTSPSKRGKQKGGEAASGQLAAVPPQMQQLLSLLSQEPATTAGIPALAALAEQAQQMQQAEQKEAQQQQAQQQQHQQDSASQRAEPRKEAQAEPQAAQAGDKPEAAGGPQSAATASAEAAATVAAEAEDAIAAAAAAAAASVATSKLRHRAPDGPAAPLVQRTPSGQAPPARQHSLLLAPAQAQGLTRSATDGHSHHSGRPPTSPQHASARRSSGGPGAPAAVGGFGAPWGATVTTGMLRANSSGAQPVTTGGGLASAGSPTHSAFAAAAAMASQVPGRVGKSGLPRVMRSESSPAAINGAQVTTGIPPLVRPQLQSARPGPEGLGTDGPIQLAALPKQGSASTGSGSGTL